MAEKVLVRVISGDYFSIVPITFFLETVTKKCFLPPAERFVLKA